MKSTDGIMFSGNVNAMTKYVCDNGEFRFVTNLEIEADSTCTSYNINEYYVLPKAYDKKNYSYYKCTEDGWMFTTEKLNQGTMVDSRDGREYKTIGIKSQMWMAENLNYFDEEHYPSMKNRNWCSSDKDSCEIFGRYYTWSAAIDSVYWYDKGKVCGFNEECVLPEDEKIQGICHSGWHIPTKMEWESLFVDEKNVRVASDKLRSLNRWHTYVQGTDVYGFSALPAGVSDNGIFKLLGEYTYFWGATNGNPNYLVLYNGYVNVGNGNGGSGYSVRCVKD